MKKTTDVTIAREELASRMLRRIEAQADAGADRTETSIARYLQLVSDSRGFSAVIKHGTTTIEIQGDSFAVTTGE